MKRAAIEAKRARDAQKKKVEVLAAQRWASGGSSVAASGAGGKDVPSSSLANRPADRAPSQQPLKRKPDSGVSGIGSFVGKR